MLLHQLPVRLNSVMPCLKSMSIQNLLVAVTHPSLSARSQQIHLIPSMQLAQSLRLPPQTLCPLIKKVDRVKCNFTKKSYQTIDLPKHITCELSNIIYLISCTKCNKHYVGETCRAFRSRMYEHKSSVSKDGKKPTPVRCTLSVSVSKFTITNLTFAHDYACLDSTCCKTLK